MGADTKIEWAHHTFNPWEGCSKVSDGCKNCYAEERNKRFNSVVWGEHGTRRRTSPANWRKPFQWDRAAAFAGERHRVFCASLADVFEDRPELDPWRADLLRVIRQTPHLEWLLLTKRPENIMRLLSDNARFVDMKDEQWHWEFAWVNGRPPENVWIGTSVENQETADKRIPELLKIPATVRFLSMEPLLGPVSLSLRWDRFEMVPGINWVIVGGESGSNARPMEPSWICDLRDQCEAAQVPFFFKQGSQANWGKFKDFDNMPCGLRIRQIPEVNHAANSL